MITEKPFTNNSSREPILGSLEPDLKSSLRDAIIVALASQPAPYIELLPGRLVCLSGRPEQENNHCYPVLAWVIGFSRSPVTCNNRNSLDIALDEIVHPLKMCRLCESPASTVPSVGPAPGAMFNFAPYRNRTIHCNGYNLLHSLSAKGRINSTSTFDRIYNRL